MKKNAFQTHILNFCKYDITKKILNHLFFDTNSDLTFKNKLSSLAVIQIIEYEKGEGYGFASGLSLFLSVEEFRFFYEEVYQLEDIVDDLCGKFK